MQMKFGYFNFWHCYLTLQRYHLTIHCGNFHQNRITFNFARSKTFQISFAFALFRYSHYSIFIKIKVLEENWVEQVAQGHCFQIPKESLKLASFNSSLNKFLNFQPKFGLTGNKRFNSVIKGTLMQIWKSSNIFVFK